MNYRVSVAAHEREKNLKKKYKLSPAGYADLLAWSGGKCCICRAEVANADGHRLYVDHDHATGKVRGLLCRECNYGLGNFRDRTDLLKISIAYLEYFTK